MNSVSKRFIDSVRVYSKAGTGGNGLPKFGGTGGKGGDVIIECVEDTTLLKTKKMLARKSSKAEVGETSKHYRLLGRDGKDLVICAPMGTLVKTDEGRTLGELNLIGDRTLVAQGGEGGCLANQFFGQKGEKRFVNLWLKLIAEIGLVGFPNAGKSTLLRAISKARPKVANYPFTTLHPTVGHLVYDDMRSISMADLPGLIEGSWANIGLGHNFLRHIERTKLLLFVVDIGGFQLSPLYPKRKPIDSVICLNRELELYQPDLVEKPCMLVVNKMDLPDSELKFQEFKEQLQNIKEISLTFPEEARPERFVDFDEIIPCAAKFDLSSVQVLKEKLRSTIDYHEDLHYKENKTLEEASLKIASQLEETLIKLV